MFGRHTPRVTLASDVGADMLRVITFILSLALVPLAAESRKRREPVASCSADGAPSATESDDAAKKERMIEAVKSFMMWCSLGFQCVFAVVHGRVSLR